MPIENHIINLFFYPRIGILSFRQDRNIKKEGTLFGHPLKMTCPKMTLLRFANRVRKFIFVNLLPLIWFVWE
jgi:hypothetical protein